MFSNGREINSCSIFVFYILHIRVRSFYRQQLGINDVYVYVYVWWWWWCRSGWFEKVTRASLAASSKSYHKLLKKQEKDKEAMRKKQSKERALMQKQHSVAVDKLNSAMDKTATTATSNAANQTTATTTTTTTTSTNSSGGAVTSAVVAAVATVMANNNNSNNNNRESVVNGLPTASTAATATASSTTTTTTTSTTSELKEMVDEQSRAWSALLERQKAEEKQLNVEQMEQQCACLQQLLADAQKQRRKDVEAKQKK